MTNVSGPVTVLGAGSWGTALAIVLAKNGSPVRLWDRNEKHLKEITETGQNKRYIPDVVLPSNITCYPDLKTALESSQDVLIAVPSHAFVEMLQKIKAVIFETPSLQENPQRFFWATKGLEPKSGEFLHQVIERELGKRPYAVLSGPSFAQEVAKELPTAVTIAANQEDYAFLLAEKFSNNFFRAYSTQDLIGVQLGGVVKNILAVAAGISDGLQLGSNARAALITRGLAEMMRLGEALGAKRETLMGLAGCGDVILSCTDNQSRNRRFGFALAEGLNESEAIQKVGQVIEAVYNVEQLCRLARKRNVELPIAEQVFRIVKQGLSPKQAVTTLFARALKSE